MFLVKHIVVLLLQAMFAFPGNAQSDFKNARIV
jgi:hypothetical protein